MLPVTILTLPDTAPTKYFLSPEKLLTGNPEQTVWDQYTSPDQKFLVGFWQSEPGKWRINYTEDEFCEQLEGTSIITDANGNQKTVCAGDSYVIPRGFKGTWEVVKTTRKRYVISMP